MKIRDVRSGISAGSASPHQYVNIDEDLDALYRAMALNGGTRRTPTIDLGLGGPPLVEPDNDSLTGALIEIDMLSQADAIRAARRYRTSATSSAC